MTGARGAGGRRALVYELLEGGSLHSRIHDGGGAAAGGGSALSAAQRVRVALDIARGLAHLHGLDAGVVVGVRSGTLTAVVHLTC